MIDIEDCKRKKRKALVILLIFSALFMVILFRIPDDEILLAIFIPPIMIWTKFLIDYEKISVKIEILKELQNKKELNENNSG